MTIAKAEVALRGKDETAQAFRSVVRNAETAQKQISQKFRSAFNLLGIGTAIYGLTRAVSGAIKAGDDLAKFAEKSGLAAEAASELAHAAKMTDIDLGALETGLKKMQVTLSQAGSGTKAATATLTALGLTFEQLQALKPDQQFELIAEQISQLKDPADRTRAAVELFGRAGADLLPLFTEGAAGIRRAREEAQQLGKSFSAENLKAMQDADDAIKKMKASASSLADVLAIKLAPAIAAVFDKLRKATGGGTERENLIDSIEHQIEQLAGSGAAHSAKRIEELKARLDVLMNPRSDALAGRGRVAKAAHPVIGFIEEVGKQAKLSKTELEKLELQLIQLARLQMPGGKQVTDPRGRNFTVGQLRPEVSASESAYLNQTIGPTMEQNAASVAESMREINAENVQATSRTIELGDAFKVADENAKGMMATLKDEAARRGFGAISDAIYNASLNAKDFASEMLNAFRRILADKATQQLYDLFASMGKGGGGGGGGFWGSIASGIGSFFSGFGKSSTSGKIPGLASGGFMSPGSMALVGEQGPELAVAGPRGAQIIPFGKSGGGDTYTITIAPVNHVDARGATADLAKMLPGILRESNRQAVAEAKVQIVDDLRRRKYRLG